MRRWLALPALALLLATGACVAPLPPAEVPPFRAAGPRLPYPYPPVPAPRVEAILPQPPGQVVWQGGHWHWDGREYAWFPGRWIERPAIGERFVPGRWAWTNQGWGWIPAHWQ